jgi:hypothetical protein
VRLRLDLALIQHHPELSRRRARDVIEKGQVTVAGHREHQPTRSPLDRHRADEHGGEDDDQVELTEADAEGDLPQMSRDVPPNTGNYPVSDPSEIAHPENPTKQRAAVWRMKILSAGNGDRGLPYTKPCT